MGANLSELIAGIVGCLAAIGGIVGIFPQMKVLHKTNYTASISLEMYVLYFLGCVVWTVYGFGVLATSLQGSAEKIGLAIFGALPLILLNSVGVIASAYILYKKIINMIFSKKYSMNEADYCYLYLKFLTQYKNKQINVKFAKKNKNNFSSNRDVFKKISSREYINENISLVLEEHK